MLTEERLKEAKSKYNILKCMLHFNSNIHMIRYYNRYLYRIDRVIKANML